MVLMLTIIYRAYYLYKFVCMLLKLISRYTSILYICVQAYRWI